MVDPAIVRAGVASWTVDDPLENLVKIVVEWRQTCQSETQLDMLEILIKEETNKNMSQLVASKALDPAFCSDVPEKCKIMAQRYVSKALSSRFRKLAKMASIGKPHRANSLSTKGKVEGRNSTPTHSSIIDSAPPGGELRPEQILQYSKPVPTIQAIQDIWFGNMLTPDKAALDLYLGAMIAHRFEQEGNFCTNRPWMKYQGPPSSGKSELIMLGSKYHESLSLSEITRKTFFSGLDMKEAVGGVEPSLMLRRPNAIMLIKDLTTLLTRGSEERQEIFGQFTELFDGKKNANFGTGKDTPWFGCQSAIVGVTDVIERHYKWINQLGPRFLTLKMWLPSPESVAKAVRMQKTGWQSEAQDMVANYLYHLPQQQPSIEEELALYLDSASIMLAGARTPVERENHIITSVNQKEQPTRVVSQLVYHTAALALAYGRETVDMWDVHTIMREVWDSIPAPRRHVLSKFTEPGMSLNQTAIVDGHMKSDDIMEEAIVDLERLEILESKGNTYQLRPEYAPHLAKLVEASKPKPKPEPHT